MAPVVANLHWGSDLESARRHAVVSIIIVGIITPEAEGLD